MNKNPKAEGFQLSGWPRWAGARAAGGHRAAALAAHAGGAAQLEGSRSSLLLKCVAQKIRDLGFTLVFVFVGVHWF